MVSTLSAINLQTLCAAPCKIDSSALVDSNYDGMGKAAFEKLIHITQTALDYLRQTPLDGTSCKVFSETVKKFYEIADRDPDLIHSPKILPESAICLIQNTVAHKADEKSLIQLFKSIEDSYKDFWSNRNLADLAKEVDQLEQNLQDLNREYASWRPTLDILDRVQGLCLIILGASLLISEIPKLQQKNISTYLKMGFGLGLAMAGVSQWGYLANPFKAL